MRKLKVCTLGLVTMSMVVSTAIPTGKGWFGTNTSVYADTNITQNNMLMDTNANAYRINTLADANLQLPVANTNPKLLTNETTEESNVRQGKCGDNVFYKFDEKTRILTISGKGDMWDDYGFTKTMNNVKSIVVESGVTSIGAYSFLDLNYVTGVTMADTVTTINEYAFPMVDGTVEIPSSVVKVKSFAFDNAQRYLVKCDVKGFETSAFGYLQIVK